MFNKMDLKPIKRTPKEVQIDLKIDSIDCPGVIDEVDEVVDEVIDEVVVVVVEEGDLDFNIDEMYADLNSPTTSAPIVKPPGIPKWMVEYKDNMAENKLKIQAEQERNAQEAFVKSLQVLPVEKPVVESKTTFENI